jgi:hypothetical protein
VAERERLDITKLKTVEDLNNTPWEDYAGEGSKQWVRYIKYPVAASELDRVNELSFEKGCNVKITWNMGDLYFSRLKTFEA